MNMYKIDRVVCGFAFSVKSGLEGGLMRLVRASARCMGQENCCEFECAAPATLRPSILNLICFELL